MPNVHENRPASSLPKYMNKNNFDGKVFQSFKLLLATSDLFFDIQKIRKKFNIDIPIDQKITMYEFKQKPIFPQVTINSLEQLNKESEKIFNYIQSQKPIPAKEKIHKIRFSDAVDKLLRKYDLPNLYLRLVSCLISTGQFNWNDEDLSEPAAYFFTSDTVDGERRMAIRIYPETSLNDIIDEWSEIFLSRKRFLTGKPVDFMTKEELKTEKFPIHKNIDRDLRIAQLRKSGRTSKEIAEIIKGEFYINVFTYADVNDALKKLKNYSKKIMAP